MCLATPGAGKTTMASVLSKKLFESELIDLVICFSPSAIVSQDFRIELQHQCQKRFDGSLGSSGCSLTYQGMLCLDDEFWKLLHEFRVFIIFDEIHHCAGGEISQANAWGEKIANQIQGKAAYTLALTGTPWRSNRTPIVLSNYCDNNRVQCNYSYGLAQAINDGVCRVPHITMVDNEQITLKQGRDETEFSSFGEMLNKEKISYQDLVENDELLAYLLKQADQRLNHIRNAFPNAGGLIVASSVTHARKIHRLLSSNLNEQADIATYLEKDAATVIQRYKNTTRKWIISVGMISEGTNIPRLQVCCHLTRVKTELYFRQILGRILRASGNTREIGYLYIPAEPSLMEYAYRISEDVPSDIVVVPHSLPEVGHCNSNKSFVVFRDNHHSSHDLELIEGGRSILSQSFMGGSTLSADYENSFGEFGRFKKEIFSLLEHNCLG